MQRSAIPYVGGTAPANGEPHLLEHGLGSGIQLWLVSLDTYRGSTRHDDGHATPGDRTRRQPHPDRRAWADNWLRQLLADHTGFPAESMNIIRGSRGKPCLAGHPLHFNLSHSDGFALIGISVDRPVGVDLEVLGPVQMADQIARDHFTNREREEWAGTTPSQRHRAFLSCWTRKEACAKAVGGGVALPFRTLAVGCATGTRSVRIGVDGIGIEVLVSSLDLPAGLVGAAAVLTSV